MTQRNPLTRQVPATPVTVTRSLSDVYQPADPGVPLSQMVGVTVHIYGIETFTSDQYGAGVRLSVREADAAGNETSDEYVAYTFAFRIRDMAKAVLGESLYAPFNPPVRARVNAFSTGKGQSYELVDA